jgi:hypothetical protein
MDEKLTKNIVNNKLNMTTQGFNPLTHKRGQTLIINNKGDIPISTIQA